ncbi:MAG: DNA-packaging protein [Shimia sp.]
MSSNAATAPRPTDPTTTPSALRSGAAWIASAPPETQAAFLADLSDAEAAVLPWLWEFWAHDHQLPPEGGGWRTWVCMGGRGAGKTRAGAEWVRALAEGPTPRAPGRARRIALLGETYDQAREVMVMGDSGILACCPPDRRPTWEAGRRRLVWPNGAIAQVHSAHEPEALRGPQFDAAWADEMAKWKKADEAWDMLEFALRLGAHPQAMVTTTPRNVDVLKRLLAAPSTVLTTAPTEANRAHLARSFLAEVRHRYAGTRLGRQELDGVLLEDTEGALWRHDAFDGCRVGEVPPLDRVVVAVDPPAGSSGDLCGIVVAGAVLQGPPSEWRAYVLADYSVAGQSPLGWAETAVLALWDHGGDRLVAEVNQGGEMVETIVRQVDASVPYRGVHASRGKVTRAEPIAALYEQGRVFHAAGLDALEDQMARMTARGFSGRGSPDRVDALVWALSDLMLGHRAQAPRMRSL